MATKAHCAFCFETLAANFERRQPLNLSQVEDLWEQYRADSIDQGQSEGELGSEEEDDREDDADMTDAEAGAEPDEPPAARPAAISRLLNRDISATSSSSSLPSTKSAASSTQSHKAPLGTETPASSSSSTTSRSSLAPASKKRPVGTSDKYPLFVTWNTLSRRGHNSLRGCIGTFEPQQLEHGLRSYALTSAFEDVRFQPIPATLLPSLSAHVTLLTDFSTPSKEPMDWTLGKHGIRISFTYHGRRYGSTYLPDVAKEQGWTKEEALISLMRKAGWNGGSSSWLRAWKDGKGELITYEGKQVALHYDEWRQWRTWVDEQGTQIKPLN